MTYNVQIYLIRFDKTKTPVFYADRITKENLGHIIKYILPLYNPIAHEIIISANITREEAEGIK